MIRPEYQNWKQYVGDSSQVSFSLGSEDPEHRISDPGSEIRILGPGFLDLNARYLKRNHFAFMLYLR